MQVITIHKDGAVSGLQVKRSQGLDLKQLGHAHISRSSHVVWNYMLQCWKIAFLTGPLAGGHLDLDTLIRARIPDKADPGVPFTVDPDTAHLLFEEYEDAVALEHEVHQGYRLQGVFLCG